MGHISHKSVPRSATHFSGNRESFSEEFDNDSNSVNFMDWPNYDFQQNISALDAQLAHLKTSINRQNRARKKGSSPRESSNSDQPAEQPTCTSCGKVGHSKSDRKCPALRSKCHNCQRIGHWSVVCRSPTVTSASLGRAIKSHLKGTSINRTQWTLFVGPCISGSNGKKTEESATKSTNSTNRHEIAHSPIRPDTGLFPLVDILRCQWLFWMLVLIPPISLLEPLICFLQFLFRRMPREIGHPFLQYRSVPLLILFGRTLKLL